MKNFILLLSLALCGSVSAKRIALTFDDAPRAATSMSGPDRAKALIEQLKKANVPRVAFFANSERLDAEGRNRLKAYAKAGHAIGNHTHSHPDLNTVTVKEYVDNIEKAHKALSKLDGFVPWFRYPFLREGDTEERRDGVRKALKQLGYFNAYVTVDNADYKMDALFQQAYKDGKTIDGDALKKTYVETLVDSAKYYEDLAQKFLKRSPGHILLLHENDLAAKYISDVVEALRKDGWDIVTPEEAYLDDLNKYEAKTLLKNNPGRIGEVARDEGERGDVWHPLCDEKLVEQLFITNGVVK